jgi:hypothetical protein
VQVDAVAGRQESALGPRPAEHARQFVSARHGDRTRRRRRRLDGPCAHSRPAYRRGQPDLSANSAVIPRHRRQPLRSKVQRRIFASDRRGDDLACLEGAVSAGPQLLASAGGACWQDAGQQHRAAPAGPTRLGGPGNPAEPARLRPLLRSHMTWRTPSPPPSASSVAVDNGSPARGVLRRGRHPTTSHTPSVKPHRCSGHRRTARPKITMRWSGRAAGCTCILVPAGTTFISPTAGRKQPQDGSPGAGPNAAPAAPPASRTRQSFR